MCQGEGRGKGEVTRESASDNGRTSDEEPVNKEVGNSNEILRSGVHRIGNSLNLILCDLPKMFSCGSYFE